MPICSRVGGSLLGSGDSAAQQNGIDAVGRGAGVFVEREDHQGPVDVEVGVCEEGREPVARPAAGE